MKLTEKLRARIVATALVTALAASAYPQQPSPAPPPDVPAILLHISQNYSHYLHTVPNLIADEQLKTSFINQPLSTTIAPAPSSLRVGTPLSPPSAGQNSGSSAESTFTVHRPEENTPGKLPTLTESREFKTIDHRPAAPNAQLDSPVSFHGGFSYAVGFLLPAMADCTDYHLRTNAKYQRKPAILLEYSTKRNLPQNSICSIGESYSGRAFLDPENFQILRLEQKRTKHKLPPDDPANAFLTGDKTLEWEWSIDYAPVTLGGNRYWLPATISSRLTGERNLPQWSFLAHYSNYHLFGATTEILVPRKNMYPKQ